MKGLTLSSWVIVDFRSRGILYERRSVHLVIIPKPDFLSIPKAPSNTSPIKRYLWSRTYFHILEGVVDFLTSKKSTLDRYFSETTFVHTLCGSLMTFQPNLASKAALTSWTFLISRPPSHLGLQILSQEITGNGSITVGWIHVILPEKSLFFYQFL